MSARPKCGYLLFCIQIILFKYLGMEELNYTFLASFLLVGISLLYSYKEGLGIEKKIAVS